MNISFEASYYNFIKYDNLKSEELYHKFLNWIQGEFDLYQIDNFEGVKVYFPNGWFSIDIINDNEKCIKIVTKIKCKTLKGGKEMGSTINTILSNLKKLSQN